MNILYVTTIGGTMGFFENFIKELLAGGHTVDAAANETISKVPDCYREWGCQVYQLSCSRSPLDKRNLEAIRQIQRIVADGRYDIVHCHTPIAAMCTRFACRKLRKQGTKVFYTAHGFHFYKGAPLKNWLIYYPVEWLCAHWTDTLITINQEDYAFAQKHLHAGRVEYVPGVGIDVAKFRDAKVDRGEKRRQLGMPKDAFLLLSVGELNENKNHITVIRALAALQDKNVHYAIAGRGKLYDTLLQQARELGVADQLYLLGHRDDMPELYKAADVDVFPSIREGLGLAAIEGMVAGLPLICADNRGTRDYATKENAIVCNATDVDAYAAAIQKLRDDEYLREQMGIYATQSASRFERAEINSSMKRIYGI